MKWLIGVGLAILLGAGVFFYLSDNSEVIEEKQTKIVNNTVDPLKNAEEAGQDYEDSQSQTEEQVEEIMGEG